MLLVRLEHDMLLDIHYSLDNETWHDVTVDLPNDDLGTLEAWYESALPSWPLSVDVRPHE